MIADMLISKNAWKYAQDSLLPYLLSSIQLIAARGQGSIAAQSEKILSSDFADEGSHEPLKFDIVCGVVTTLLVKISNDMDMKPLKGEGGSEILGESFCLDLILRFFHPLLLVVSQTGNDMERQSAIKVFLPSVLRIIDNLKGDMHRESL